MTDSTLNRFLAEGTNAQRLAFTPTPPTPASGPAPLYIWFETDTSNTYAWNITTTAWVQVNTGGGGGGGVLDSISAPVGNGNDTTEDILASYSLPASTLATNGAVLDVFAHFTIPLGNTHIKTVRLYFGSVVFSIATAASTLANIIFRMRIIRYSGTTQWVSCQIIGGVATALTAAISGAGGSPGSETLSAAVVIKATGQTNTAVAGDVVLNAFTVSTP